MKKCFGNKGVCVDHWCDGINTYEKLFKFYDEKLCELYRGQYLNHGNICVLFAYETEEERQKLRNFFIKEEYMQEEVVGDMMEQTVECDNYPNCKLVRITSEYGEEDDGK